MEELTPKQIYDAERYLGMREERKAQAKKHYQRSKGSHRSAYLKRKFGISLEEYDEMLKSQFGSCAICDKICEKSLAVDHDHKTGKNRGLLCFTCNSTLGHFEKGNLPTKEDFEKYLSKYK